VLLEDAGFSGISKSGAEGVRMAILPKEGLGIALKVDDGGNRAADAILVAVLDHLGVIDGLTRDRLACKINPQTKNLHGEVISHIRIKKGQFNNER